MAARTTRDRAGASVAGGLLMGGVAGAAEHLLFHFRLSGRGALELVYSIGLYAALGAIVGLAFALIWCAILAVGPSGRRAGGLRWPLSFHFVWLLYLLVGFRLNSQSGMPPAASAMGLLINGLLVAAMAVGGLGLYALLGRVRAGNRILDRIRPAFSVLIAVPVLIVISLAGFGVVRAVRDRPAPPPAADGQGRAHPNVILILVDALRQDHVSGYGYDRRTSLALDHLMDEAVTFEHAFSASNWTIPSIASLFTGVSPSTHGVLGGGDRLPRERATLAEALGRAGYACGASFGNAIVDIGGGFDRGFHHRHPRPKPFWCFRLQTAVERIAMRFLRGSYFWGPVVLREAEVWVEAHRSRPFFLYVHLMEPHSPYGPPAPYDRVFDPDYDGSPVRMPPLERADVDQGFRDWEAMPAGRAALPERERQNMIALYDGEIGYVDSLIDGFLKRLREMGLYEGSLIVVTADHGEEFYDHGGWFHGQSLYDELIRVPLIVKMPGQLLAGSRPQEPVSGVDLVPSILSVAGVSVPEGVEGVDVFGPVDRVPPDRPVFSERPPFLYSVRQGRWKLIRKDVRGGTDLRLFDLERDPEERVDEADAFGEIRDALAAMLAPRAARLTTGALSEEGGELDAYDRERLKALGYIQ